MLRIFDFLLLLYPRPYRLEFGAEMRRVFQDLAGSADRSRFFLLRESCALAAGAVREHSAGLADRAPALAGGALFAGALQFLVYWCLLPVKNAGLGRVLARMLSHLLMLCIVVGLAFSQQAKQDPATLELARGIYSDSFTALREARTLDDLHKLSDNIDAAEWISVDRFGRTVLTKEGADRDLQSLLALPPERRVSAMDIIWAEQDSGRLIVVAWMMPNTSNRVDASGEYGEKGASHQFTRATLIRDVFQQTEMGWRRVRHDKLTPNDMLVAVDGKARIIPPLDDQHRAAPAH